MAEKFDSKKALPWIIATAICWFFTLNIVLFFLGGMSNRTDEGIISSDMSINILKIACLAMVFMSVLLTLKTIRVGTDETKSK